MNTILRFVLLRFNPADRTPPMLLNEFQKQQRRIKAFKLELQEIKLALRAR